MQITDCSPAQSSVRRAGRLGRIMIVEDDALLSMMMEDMIRELGADEVLVCNDHTAAISAAREADVTAAVLDVFVHGKPTYDVADSLAERGVAVMFCSGLTLNDIDDGHRHIPFLPKPYSDDELRDCLNRAIAVARSGA